MAEALRTVAGFQVTDERSHAALGARGFSLPGDWSNRILLLVDGHRVNESVFHSPDFQGWCPVPLEAVERIEVVHGPASVLHGSDALFAVINMNTRTGAKTGATTLQAQVGSQDTWRTVASTGLVSARGTDFAITGLAQGARGDRTVSSPGGPSVRNADGSSVTNLFTRLGRGHRTLTAAASGRRKDIPTAPYATVPVAGTSTIDGRQWIDLGWRREFRSGVVAAASGSLDRHADSGHYLYDHAAPGEPADLQPWRDSADATWLHGSAEVQVPLGRRASFSSGFDAEHPLQMQIRAWSKVDGTVLDVDVDVPEASWSAFAQFETRIARKVTLVTGARWSAPAGPSTSLDRRIALIIRPTRRTSIKLLEGSAFRAPSPHERFYASGDYRPNPALRGESLRVRELVLSHEWPRGLEARISAFQQTAEGLIAEAEVEPGISQSQNLDSRSSRGLELSLARRWSSGWRLRTTGLLQQPEDRSDSEVANSPAGIATLSLVAPLPLQGATHAVDSQWLGQRRTLSGAAVPSSTLTSLHLRVPQPFGARGLVLTFSARNLFDEAGLVPAGPEHGQDAIPAPHRTLMVGASWTF